MSRMNTRPRAPALARAALVKQNETHSERADDFSSHTKKESTARTMEGTDTKLVYTLDNSPTDSHLPFPRLNACEVTKPSGTRNAPARERDYTVVRYAGFDLSNRATASKMCA